MGACRFNINTACGGRTVRAADRGRHGAVQAHAQTAAGSAGLAFPRRVDGAVYKMGAASYLVFASGASRVRKNRALTFYAVQLGMNFFWPVIFFTLEMYLTAFLWLLGLWGLVLVCTLLFYHIDRRAGRLMIPYLLWITFAGYLNLGIYVLN